MDILLIDPPYKSLKGIGIDCAYTMGLTSIAAYLNASGIDSFILTCDLLADMAPGNILNMDASAYAQGQEAYKNVILDNDHPIWTRISNVIKESNPKAVGITYLTPAKAVVEKIAAIIKKINHATPVIVGGHHPTFCSTDILTNNNIDFAIKGEGEIPLLKLANEIISGNNNWSSVPGLTYRMEAGSIRSTKETDFIYDLDTLPFAARDHVLQCNYQAYKTHYFYTSRGCPYTCAFCSDSRMWRHKVRRRSVKHVIDELCILKAEYDPAFVDFSDGTFTYDMKYLKDFCEQLIAEDLNLMWRCTARYDNLSTEMLKLMKKSNCFGLYFGLESGSDRILDEVNKNITPTQILEASKMVKDSGIISMASVLLGLPDEKLEDVELTLELMRSLNCDLFDINCYVPLPGTKLFNEMEKNEFDNIDWMQVGFKSLTTNFSNHIDNQLFEELLVEAYQIADEARLSFLDQMAGLTI